MPITEIGKRLKKAIQAKSLMQIQVVEMAAPLLEARGMKLSPSKHYGSTALFCRAFFEVSIPFDCRAVY